MTSTGKVDLLDLAAAALAATVAAARPIRDLSSFGSKHNARLKKDGSVLTDADFFAQGAIMRTIQQVLGHVRIVGEDSEEKMLRHLREEDDDECRESQVYQLAREDVQMQYHNRKGRLPLSGADSRLHVPLAVDVDNVDSSDVIVDSDRVSIFVDPLYGTKSYARADYNSVTFLIAIMLDNAPCFGVICRPFGYKETTSIVDTGCVAIYGGELLNGVYVAEGSKFHKPLSPEGELPQAVISKSQSEGTVRDFVDEMASKQVIYPEPQQTVSRYGRDKQEHFENVCDSFRQYATFAMCHWKNQQHRLEALPESERRLLPAGLRCETEEGRKRFSSFKDAAIRNQFCLDCILQHAGKAHSQQVTTVSRIVTDGQISKVTSVLKSLARDWSQDGRAERDMAYAPILEAVQEHVPIENNASRICVPGAGKFFQRWTVEGLCISALNTALLGVGRLAFELVTRGYAVQGNEFSLHMLLASDFILNNGQSRPMAISPWLLESCNVHSPDDPVR